MDRDHLDFLIKRLKKQEKVNPVKFMRAGILAESSTEAMKPFINFIDNVYGFDKILGKKLFIGMVKCLIVTYSDDFDDSYRILNDIKEMIIKEETKFNKSD